MSWSVWFRLAALAWAPRRVARCDTKRDLSAWFPVVGEVRRAWRRGACVLAEGDQQGLLGPGVLDVLFKYIQQGMEDIWRRGLVGGIEVESEAEGRLHTDPGVVIVG
jgi:hypothetical protein